MVCDFDTFARVSCSSPTPDLTFGKFKHPTIFPVMPAIVSIGVCLMSMSRLRSAEE